MDLSLQITIAAFGSVGALVAALVLNHIILVRWLGPQMDTAAEERRILREGQQTLLKRIERLRERPMVQQFLLVDGRRWDFLAVGPGHLDAGGVPVPASSDLYEKLQQYPGVDIEMVILKRGAGSLLSAIPVAGEL